MADKASEQPFFPWEDVRWRTRRFALTDCRLASLSGDTIREELALYDVGPIDVEASGIQGLIGFGTIVVRSTRQPHTVIRLPWIWNARQVAMQLVLTVADLRGLPPDDSVSGLPLPQVWRRDQHLPLRAALIAPALLLVTAMLVVVGLNGHEMPITFGPDDPVRPNGVARSRAEIVTFMEAEVMPFARRALEPVVGVGKVRCETCHGADPEAHHWRMPAISVLPEPAVKALTAPGADAQIRNALHGYLTNEAHQATAAHMRQVVLPGMAALLRRPMYDFARSYEYNSSRAAVGCYHCHRASDQT